MTHRPAFRIDERGDCELASDGISRYGAYLDQHRRMFYPDGIAESATDDAVEYALSAWHLAGPPIMVPGYVSWHPRVQTCRVHRDDDQHCALAVEIAMPAPLTVTAELTVPWREWYHDSWRDLWSDPWENNCLTVLTTLTARVPVGRHGLPAPHYRRGIPCTSCAKDAVAIVCAALNTELNGLIKALDATSA